MSFTSPNHRRQSIAGALQFVICLLAANAFAGPQTPHFHDTTDEDTIVEVAAAEREVTMAEWRR